jgi:hypothetical protein
MNKIASLTIVILTSIVCLSCNSSKAITNSNLENNPPFKIIEATYSTWNGGQPGVQGILVNIKIDNAEIELDSVYFRNKSTKLKLEKTAQLPFYKGSFVLPNPNNNLQLDIDSTKEFGNQVPNFPEKIPFQLNQNEAIVSYYYKNKINYYKILNVVEVKNLENNKF